MCLHIGSSEVFSDRSGEREEMSTEDAHNIRCLLEVNMSS